MDNKTRISVIMPAYNTEKYIKQCLNSVSNQTLKEIEIIVVDDGSTDGTITIIEECIAIDPRIKLIKQNNQFAGVARNNGFSQANGEYVIFLDSDDFFDKEMLETMYKKAVEFDADICICGAFEYNQLTKEDKYCGEYLKRDCLPDEKGTFNKSDIPNKIFSFTCDAPWNKLYKKDFIEKHNLKFQEVKRANDTRFVNVSLALAERIVTVDGNYVHYRVGHGGNLQSTYNDRPFTFYDTMKSFLDQLKSYGVYNQVKQEYVNKATGIILNGLERMNTYEEYKNVYVSLKKHMLIELEVIGYGKEYYYNIYDYKNIRRIELLPCWVMYSIRKAMRMVC